MRIVVTGGAGFIGANLVQRFLDSGETDVVVLDDLSTGRKENLEGVDVELIEGSITEPDIVAGALAGADAVVHLAARGSVPLSVADPMATHHRNATGTAVVLEAARNVSAHLVVASSSSVYGANPVLPRHEGLTVQPVSPYAASKVATESYALAWGACFGFPVLALRFFNVYGPLQPPRHTYAAVVPAFVDAAVHHRPLPVHGDGEQTRDFTFVGDVCDAIVDGVRRRVAHDGPVNLAFGTRVSLLELIAELESILGRPLEREHQPVRAGDVRDTQADTTLLRSLFPDAIPISLREGLEQTVAWFESARPEPAA